MDFEDDEEEEVAANNFNRHPVAEQSAGVVRNDADNAAGGSTKNQAHAAPVNNKIKSTTSQVPVDDNHHDGEQPAGVGQQDEWEEFDDSKSKYDKIRLKLARGNNEHADGEDDDDDEDDEDYHDGHPSINPDANMGDDATNLPGDDDPAARNNRRREQQKEKPAWKLDQVKQPESAAVEQPADSPADKVDEAPAKPAAPAPAASSGAYRPPAMRSGASVTVVSNANQRPSKKEKPNLASTEDFPTLGAAVNRK